MAGPALPSSSASARLGQPSSSSSSRRGRPNTSALDGLRGIAALFVFFFHQAFAYTPAVEYGYGHGESPQNRSLFQLPFISLLHRGHSMVAVFFVVGGYVMALKPLSLMHSNQGKNAPASLVSSIFRRGIRIYTPAIVATFITMLSMFLGLWEYPRRFVDEEKTYIYYADMHPYRKATLASQFQDWLGATASLTDLFNYYNKDGFLLPYYNQYDPHLWTVPFEYRSSLIVAALLLAVSRCKPVARILIVASTIIFCGSWDRWELVCFLGGTLLCDIDFFLRAAQSLPSPSSSRLATIQEDDEEKLPQLLDDEDAPRSRGPLHRVSHSLRTTLETRGTKRWLLLFTAGLYLLSTPNLGIDSTPGYALLYRLTPPTYTDKKRFLQTLGALLTTWSLTNSPLLQRPFDAPLPQYLGRLSYSLYIVHGPLIHVVSYSLTPNIWLHLTGTHGWRWGLGFGISTLLLGCLVALAADLFAKHVDARAVRFARWVEGICFAPE